MIAEIARHREELPSPNLNELLKRGVSKLQGN
jgi:hypothetical protein